MNHETREREEILWGEAEALWAGVVAAYTALRRQIEMDAAPDHWGDDEHELYSELQILARRVAAKLKVVMP